MRHTTVIAAMAAALIAAPAARAADADFYVHNVELTQAVQQPNNSQARFFAERTFSFIIPANKIARAASIGDEAPRTVRVFLNHLNGGTTAE